MAYLQPLLISIAMQRAHSIPPGKTGPTPAVAVIIPAYGVAHLLHEALDSLLAQDFADWEAVVIDDGAPDDVASAVAPYLADSRIRFLATANQGVSAARNTAIAATSAPLITLLDGDDRLKPGYLQAMIAVLDARPDSVLATCNAELFGAVKNPGSTVDTPASQKPTGSLAAVMDRSFNVYIGSTFRRSAFDAIGGFDETMRQSEDLDLWVRLLIGTDGRPVTARYVDKVLGEYRVRPGSASADASRMLKGCERVYEKALALLGDRPEANVARTMLHETRRKLEMEEAISAIITGNSSAGLPRLRKASAQHNGVVWQIAMLVWRVAPGLAAPMLRWRRARHARGNVAARPLSAVRASMM